jgi:hypothetical protein
VSQPAEIATYMTGNRRIQQVTETAVMQNRNYSAEGTWGPQHWGQQGEHSSRNTQHPINHSLLLFADSISSISSNHHNKNSNSLQGKNRHQDTNQISGQSVQPKNVNINAMYDIFLPFTMV